MKTQDYTGEPEFPGISVPWTITTFELRLLTKNTVSLCFTEKVVQGDCISQPLIYVKPPRFFNKSDEETLK